ncbi:MAG: glycine--tRNA ligase subunit beta [Acidobacteriaceae bacterium]
MPDLLLEIGLEEVPARMIASAQAELLKRTLALLIREQLLAGDAGAAASNTAGLSFSTPRRLAVLIQDVRTQQPDITDQITGPAVKIAFQDGKPTAAAEAFARKCGVLQADLKTITTPKGEYLAAAITRKGRSAAEVLAAELPREIAALYWAKNMYWRPGKPERFVRPVLWLVCLLGEEVVPVEFAGRRAGRVTYGHRVLHGPAPVTILTPSHYPSQLESAFVLVDVEARRQRIRKALDQTTRAIQTVANPRWREDEVLVDAVTHLCEWPDVLLGNFEAAYLRLPEEVLVTVMRDHQKYFAIEDGSSRMAAHFLTITNIALTAENSSIIRQGNERVLRARFNDARFFWEFDQRIPLTARVALLENVTFQKDLGSYAKKSERVRALAAELTAVAAERGVALDAGAIDQAAMLAKTDLTTELVKEFTELQGIIGGLYGSSQGLGSRVADAIYDQYLPASAGDAIPRSAEGCVLGLADRMDTIANLFALGMEPSGSRDPFALRRAGNAVVRILAESTLPLRLSDLLSAAAVSAEARAPLEAFFAERIEFYLREGCNQTYDVVQAVMAAGADNLRDLRARSQAVSEVRNSADFLAVSAAFKRMKNILDQAGDAPPPGGFSFAIGTPEGDLQRKHGEINNSLYELRERHAYREALEAIATIRPQVDAFFEKVMVMDPDLEIRFQRLRLLKSIVQDFSSIADFSRIVTAG